jgi:hypothetical protein
MELRNLIKLPETLLRKLRHSRGQRVGLAMKSASHAGRWRGLIKIDVQFTADNPNLGRRFNAQRHAVASDAADHDGDIVANDQLLTNLTAQYKHDSNPP